MSTRSNRSSPFSFSAFPGGFPSASMSALFAPRKPRHALLRVLLGVVGVALLAVLLVVGVFVGAAMLLGSLALRLLMKSRTARRTSVTGKVVDAEYTIVGKTSQPLLR